MEFGFVDMQGTFTAVQDGGRFDLLHGFQGGFWTMPTFRVQGMVDKVSLDMYAFDETDDFVLIDIDTPPLEFEPEDGWLVRKYQALPLRINSTDVAGFERLDGHTGTVRCEVRDVDQRDMVSEFAITFHIVPPIPLP